MSRFELVHSDERCQIDQSSMVGLPTIVERSGIVEVPSDYLRYLAISGAPPSTLDTYAKILREFWSRLHVKRKCWTRVDDAFLRRWRNELRDKKQLKDATINQKLRTTFGLYVWAEEHGRISGVVDLSGKRFSQLPISTNLTGPNKYSCPLVFKTTEEPNRHTPTDDEVENLHVVLAGHHAVRDGLIMAWAEQTGLRRAEILSLTTQQIPATPDIQILYDREEVHSILVKLKGGRQCAVSIMPSLLDQTRDYIEFERSDTLERARSRLRGLRDCGALFLSETGMAPKPNSVSKQMARFFKVAGIRNASLHRLRAVHLTRLAERYVDVVDEQGRHLSIETIILLIKDAARWAGTGSLHRYVEVARSRRAHQAKPA